MDFGKGTRTFNKGTNGLYMCDFSQPAGTYVTMTTTVADHPARFTNRELAQAAQARDLQHSLANPPDAKLAGALDRGDIQGTRVTVADVRNATEIFGPNVDALKGRTTKRKGTSIPPTRPTRIEAVQTMYADLLFVFKIAYLVTHTEPLGFTQASSLPKTDVKALRLVLRQHL